MAFMEKRRLRNLAKSDWPDTPHHPETLANVPLTIDPTALVHPGTEPISDLLYGGLVEHLGRCVYGGLVDSPTAPSPSELLLAQPGGRLGWRKDVMQIFARDGDLETPMMRWPGGNFVSNYHWWDAIGPIEERKPMVELAWKTNDPNLFGTDEFIDYCQALDVEPYICLNMGTGTFEEALAWLEYCNGTGDTRWANLRRKNTGRDEPHNVKYWGMGNEVYGPWQVGFYKPEDYAEKCKRWAHSMKMMDPSIKLVSCGLDGISEWDREILSKCLNYIDLHSIHYYSQASPNSRFPYEENVFSPAGAERCIETCKAFIDMANAENAVMGIPAHDVRVCFDEWNVYDNKKYPSNLGGEQPYDHSDLLGFCAWLNLLVRKSYESPVNCLAQFVNCLAPVMTKPDGVLYQSIYYPLRLFSRYMKNGHLLHLRTMPDRYVGPTHPKWIQQMQLRPCYVDTVAIVLNTPNGQSIRLSVLNRHPSADWKCNLKFEGFQVDKVELHEMYSDYMSAFNSFDHPDELKPSVRTMTGEELEKALPSMTVRKHSWCFFILDGKPSTD